MTAPSIWNLVEAAEPQTGDDITAARRAGLARPSAVAIVYREPQPLDVRIEHALFWQRFTPGRTGYLTPLCRDHGAADCRPCITDQQGAQR